jgi:predicted DCC family thiol-disulfide oxidoreductase YuxK
MAGSEITLLIDGACPLCRREARFLRRLDRGRGRIAFEDISAEGFEPSRHGLLREAVNEQIHGVLPTGRVVRGMEVFRRAYRAVGLGWLLLPTSWPLLRPLSDRAYRWFARNRHRITGRASACDNACAPHRSS